MTPEHGCRVGVVFVNHYSEALIRPRAATMVGAGFAVVVVDNSGTYPGSQPGAGREAHVGAVVDPGANIGFGAACNLGVASFDADIDVVVFHNPDTDIAPADVELLARELRGQPRPGLVAPAEQQGALLRPMGYRYPSVVREVALAAHVRLRGPSLDAPAASARVEASTSGRRFGSGALLVGSRSMFESLHGFDERYFLYVEDLDLWHRTAARADVTFCRAVTSRHASGRGSDTTAAPRELLRWLGLELFSQVHDRPGAWRAYRAIHRAAASRLVDSAPAWALTMVDLWREGASPAQVQAALRPALAARRPRDSVEPAS